MPKRTNEFQEFVAIVQRHISTDADVEESAMLTDRVSGIEREVDAVAQLTSAAGHTLLVSFEVNRRKRRATIEWVEQMAAKHESLPTHQLVLVSRAGFTKNGLALAAQKGILAVTPETLTDENAEYRIVTRLSSIWPKLVSLTPRSVGFVVERPDGSTAWLMAAEDQLVLYEDGTEVANPMHLVTKYVGDNFVQLVEQLGVPDIAADVSGDFKIDIDKPGSEIVGRDLYLRFERDDGPPELHRLTRMVVLGGAVIHVGEAQLTHARLGKADAAYGSASLGGRDVFVVVTEGEDGGKATLRFRPAKPAT